jgi:hypothetical protein
LEEGESLLQAEAQRPSEVHRAAGHVWERQTDYTTRVLYIPQSVDLSLTSNIGIFLSWKLTESFVNDD